MAIKKLVHHLNLRSTRLLPKLTLTSKIIISFFVLVSLSLIVKSISAQTNTTNTGTGTTETSELTIDTTSLQGYLDKQTAITKGNNQESWINESLSSNVVSINQAIAGTLPSNINDLYTWIPGGMIGFTNNAIASLYQPPASGTQYIAQSINSFLGKPAYADNGYGFSKLNAILDIWKTTRNAVYTLISLFFIIVGIMIILRVKINPQTTVTIQSAIPKIISTLILVTFSYAIAGLIIDISNVVLGIVLSLINVQSVTNLDIPSAMKLGFWDFYGVVTKYFVNNAVIWLATLIAGAIGGLAIGATVASGGLGLFVGVLAFALILLIVYIYAFIQIIKLFFGLAKSYITAIIHIILGPIEIGMGAIPGSKTGFSSWLRQFTAQIAVFPATVIFLVFSVFLVQTLKTNGTFWAPTVLGTGNIISAIVGLACLSLLSKIPELVPGFFGLKPSAIGKTLSDNTQNTIKKITHSTAYGNAVNNVEGFVGRKVGAAATWASGKFKTGSNAQKYLDNYGTTLSEGFDPEKVKEANIKRTLKM